MMLVLKHVFKEMCLHYLCHIRFALALVVMTLFVIGFYWGLVLDPIDCLSRATAVLSLISTLYPLYSPFDFTSLLIVFLWNMMLTTILVLSGISVIASNIMAFSQAYQLGSLASRLWRQAPISHQSQLQYFSTRFCGYLSITENGAIFD